MSKLKWKVHHMPDQGGRVVIITGATSGLGKEATKVFANKNAHVMLAVRNVQKGESVAKEIKQVFPAASMDVRMLDLSSLRSVKSFADEVTTAYSQLDVLINNAGVMACPFSRTEDGFEIQMGVNHLGHFALTGYLMPLLQDTTGSRIVATSSIAHRRGNIDFDDLNWEKRPYVTGKAYGDSKLANLYFTFELARKLNGVTNAPMVTAAHPGWTSTDLQRHSLPFRMLNPIFSQSVEQGVLPTLRAAIDPGAQPGDYFGPSGFMEMKGSPIIVKSSAMSQNVSHAKRLWELSEEQTDIRYGKII
ncbi:MAG: SDR family NAD(P)-dependent oxidoreductase [Saprospiraceae bacterium]|nr:SDR family NAD(P)-dependent oxidoreductase [Saprospiraceae bacterium]